MYSLFYPLNRKREGKIVTTEQFMTKKKFVTKEWAVVVVVSIVNNKKLRLILVNMEVRSSQYSKFDWI